MKKDNQTGLLDVRRKILILFFCIPVLLTFLSAFFYLSQMKELSDFVTKKSTAVAREFAEKIIREKATSVSLQTVLYMKLKKLDHEEIGTDNDLKSITVQRVGNTGYTFLYQEPGYDGVWRTWSHINNQFIGIDMKSLEKLMGENFNGFWKIYSGVKGGKELQGYYSWMDKDGRVRDKFMVVAPVKDTPYYIAAETYLDEFMNEVGKMETQAVSISRKTRNTILIIMAGTLVLIGFITLLYGQNLTGKIKYLTEAAERISLGDLDTTISIKSKDEFGLLGDAISRLQSSIQISIGRLRDERRK